MQEKFAIAGSPSGLGAHVFGPVVSDDGADFFIGRPVNVSGISVFDDDPPFLQGRGALAYGPPSRTDYAYVSPVDKGPGIGGDL